MTTSSPRRRVIKLMAASLAAVASPQAVMAMVADGRPKFYQWHGFALGAEVSLQLYHTDGEKAQRIIEKSVKIIKDMEALFSLYRPNSTLSLLNQQGIIHNPPTEFVDLLQTAHHISHITSGAFDITVQPLWLFYNAQQYGAKGVDYEEVRAIQKVIGYEKLSISREEISFGREGMAATLNGIAQGYATDQVSEYLKHEGLTSVLVDIGEYRALGPQADNSPWCIGVADPFNFDKFSHILKINEGAVATSSGTDDTFDNDGEYHHLFDPKTGKSSHRYSSVTVTAPEATVADALSTAFCAMPVADIKKCLNAMPSVNARLTDYAGAVIII